MQLLVPWIVMVSKKIVRLHNVDIVNLRRLQNFPRTFCTSDIRACAHLTPFAKRARNPNLCPNPNDQRDADVEQPMRSKTETVWIIHTELNLTHLSQLSLYRLEQLDAQSRASFISAGICRAAMFGRRSVPRISRSDWS